MNPRRPLDAFPTIKVKLSVLIVAAVAMTVLAFQIGLTLGWPFWFRPIVAGSAGLLMVQFLARGLTVPLRAMAHSATAMARGDYSVRVHSPGRDEVGRLSEAFNAMAAELAETDRLRRQFVANASHELRTPVSILRSTLENMVDGVTAADHDSLNRLLTRTEQLSELVNQLLDLSRLDAGIRDLETTSVDLDHLLHHIIDDLHTAHSGVEFEIRSPLGLRMEAERAGLRSTFTNIIANAARHSPPGGVVTVTATRAGDRVRVSVRDTGPGIAPEDRHRVFDRFWRNPLSPADRSAASLAPADRPDGGGAGLGLAIAKQIVEQHEGNITVTGNEPNGACFIVELPITGAEAPLSLPMAREPRPVVTAA